MKNFKIISRMLEKNLSVDEICFYNGITPAQLEDFTEQIQQSKNGFTPLVIGTPDYDFIERHLSMLKKFAEINSTLLQAINKMFGFDLSLSEYESLYNSKNLNESIIAFWVVKKNISIPGINTEKLIRSGLVEIPDFSYILERAKDCHMFVEQNPLYKNQNLSEKFVELFNGSSFEVTDKSFARIKEECTFRTTTEQQNKILDSLEIITDELQSIQSELEYTFPLHEKIIKNCINWKEKKDEGKTVISYRLSPAALNRLFA